MSLLLTSVSYSKPKTTEKIAAKKTICFSRDEAEDIYRCLEMRKLYEDSMYASPIFDEREDGFLKTTYGQVFLIGIGLFAGFAIGKGQ